MAESELWRHTSFTNPKHKTKPSWKSDQQNFEQWLIRQGWPYSFTKIKFLLGILMSWKYLAFILYSLETKPHLQNVISSQKPRLSDRLSTKMEIDSSLCWYNYTFLEFPLLLTDIFWKKIFMQTGCLYASIKYLVFHKAGPLLPNFSSFLFAFFIIRKLRSVNSVKC